MYIVEGNIGVGKSTFLNLINKHDSAIDIIMEPMDNWANQAYGQSLLGQFYEKPDRWAYTLETLAMMCRVKDHRNEQNNPNQNTLFERSIYSGHYCFAKNGFASGFMSELEWTLYNKWFNFLIPNKCLSPTGFIYLKTDPQIAYERLRKRNRLAEKKITLKYLKQIHACHEEFLVSKIELIHEIKEVPVLILECNEEFENDSPTFNLLVDRVRTFLQKTQLAIPSDQPFKHMRT